MLYNAEFDAQKQRYRRLVQVCLSNVLLPTVCGTKTAFSNI